jgi:Galactose oxidase, central domain/Kelch motif
MKKITIITILHFSILSVYAQNQWTFLRGHLVSDAIWTNPRPFPTGVTNYSSSPFLLHEQNFPSVREHCSGGVVNENEIYMYGGESIGQAFMSDMWVFDISQGKWAFVADKGHYPNYGTQGVESPVITPGGRNRAASAVDSKGNIWLFGGNWGSPQSDLFKFNPKTGNWTFITSNNDYNLNKPFPRYRVRAWFDAEDNFWIYGGAQYNGEAYNDLWKFNTTTNQWIFISGNKNLTYPMDSNNGVYPATEGTGGTQYFPRSRCDYLYWVDNEGNFWVYGGYLISHGSDELGDFWKFNPSTNEWFLMTGSRTINLPKTSTYPGSRNAAYCWKGNDGHLYLRGGQRLYSHFLSDIYRYKISEGVWEEVAPINDSNLAPISAGNGIENSTNRPGGQVCTLNHITTKTHTYLFSGYGYGINGVAGYTGGIWRYSLDNYDPTKTPILKKDTLSSTFKTDITLKIVENDNLKTDSCTVNSIDLDITKFGIQDSVITTNGIFYLDSLELHFVPNPTFRGTEGIQYKLRNKLGYDASNVATAQFTITSCATDSIGFRNPDNELTQGHYLIQGKNTVTHANSVISINNNEPLRSRSTSEKSILLLPGMVVAPNSRSVIEFKIEGCPE